MIFLIIFGITAIVLVFSLKSYEEDSPVAKLLSILLIIVCLVQSVGIINSQRKEINDLGKQVINTLDKPPCPDLDELIELRKRGYNQGYKDGVEVGKKLVFKNIFGTDSLLLK